MAKLIIDNNPHEIPDGTAIADVCELAGVPFSCHSGICGTCQIEILEGADCLSPVNSEEDEMGMDINNRLCCQCKIISGTVKITF